MYALAPVAWIDAENAIFVLPPLSRPARAPLALGRGARLVWLHLSVHGPEAADDLVTVFHEETGAPRELLDAQITALLADLVAQGLLEEVDLP